MCPKSRVAFMRFQAHAFVFAGQACLFLDRGFFCAMCNAVANTDRGPLLMSQRLMSQAAVQGAALFLALFFTLFWTLGAAGHDMAMPDLTAEELSVLAAGKPLVEVEKSQVRKAAKVRAMIEIDAPRPLLFALMTDCMRAPDYVPGLENCRILERGPGGQWDIREHVVDPGLLGSDRVSQFKNSYSAPETIRVSRTGGDLTYLEGAWRLTALTPTRTRVAYDAEVGADVPMIPNFILRDAMKGNTEDVLLALKAEAETEAAARASDQASDLSTEAADP